MNFCDSHKSTVGVIYFRLSSYGPPHNTTNIMRAQISFAADQRLCFSSTDSQPPLLLIFDISSLKTDRRQNYYQLTYFLQWQFRAEFSVTICLIVLRSCHEIMNFCDSHKSTVGVIYFRLSSYGPPHNTTNIMRAQIIFAADQRLCFSSTDSQPPLLLIFDISSFDPASVTV